MAAHSSIVAWRIPWTEEPGIAKSRTRLTRLSTRQGARGLLPIPGAAEWRQQSGMLFCLFAATLQSSVSSSGLSFYVPGALLGAFTLVLGR